MVVWLLCLVLFTSRTASLTPVTALPDASATQPSMLSVQPVTAFHEVSSSVATQPIASVTVPLNANANTLISVIRIDCEMKGVIKSTFTPAMRLMLRTAIAGLLRVPTRSVKVSKLTEWDVSLVVHFRYYPAAAFALLSSLH